MLREILETAGGEIINHINRMIRAQQAIHEVTSDKPRPAGHNNRAIFKLHESQSSLSTQPPKESHSCSSYSSK
jgi:hypothetical protein